jgi:hypothetical protein
LPIPGIKQIVGHTPGPEVREKRGKDSENYCIDVRNGAAVALMDDGRVSIHRR